MNRQTFIISDLHLGGVYARDAAPNDRGFRICTHANDLARFIDALTAKPAGDPMIELVINGDLVDFLAERNAQTGEFASFNFDQDAALRKLGDIVTRDRVIFDALGRFLARGHRLVILLGNHDIELTMPAVRAALARAVGAMRGTDYEFVPGDEAYVVGDTLIEHGNRYDAWNMVDHEGLQRIAASLSRSQRAVREAFTPPPGSEMVARVINPIKEQYKFVDLLKPETGAVVPLLLALEPGFRSVMGKVALLAARARNAVRVSVQKPTQAAGIGSDIGSWDSMDSFGSDIASGFDASAPAAPTDGDGALDALLREQLGADAGAVRSVLNENAPRTAGSDISTFGEIVDRTVGMARLLLATSGTDHRARLNALLAAFRSLQNDQTFDETVETAKEYLDAATGLASNGIRNVVFGHTHMAKRIPLPSGGFYLNSGTWADVMEFPRNIVAGDRDTALARLGEFVQNLVDGNFSSYALFRPTYVRLDVAADGTAAASLCRYTDPAQV
ncbi:MAG TPA: hypothetical protein VE967_11475 [Gemmatimonadaceae bacterium]|nr:hypothetical protein [Gemmatimonadaceae bacterium]